VSTSLPLVLLVDSDRATHDLLDEILPVEECKFIGTGSVATARKVAQLLAPSILVVDAATVGEMKSFVESVGLARRAPRLLILAGPDLAAADVVRLATFGPVLHKPLLPDRVRETLCSLIQLCLADGGVSAPTIRSMPSQVWRRLTTTRFDGAAGRGRAGA
jgi:hypothetical protein